MCCVLVLTNFELGNDLLIPKVFKMDIRETTFHLGEGRARQGAQPRHSLSVCLFRGELVRAGSTNRDETFGGDIWHCQEHISLKTAGLVEIWML